MSRKLKIDLKADDVQIRYANSFATKCSIISPKNLIVIAGRATSKTGEILSGRTMDISYQMPGCYIALTTDTYMNAIKNIVPELVEGWKRKGWREGRNFVINEKPPKHFKKPYKTVLSWRHTISIFTGTVIFLISQDRPSIGAGNSYQSIIGDESKYLIEKKLSKLNPALRGGDIRFMNSHLYGSRTFVTDMPNINHNEHDWILRWEKNMVPDQIQKILATALVVNDLKKELYNAEKDNKKKLATLLKRNLERWNKRLKKIRKNSTFFAIASSFTNVDILRLDFFKGLLESMSFREFMISVLSIKPKLEKGLRFYPTLSEKNFYTKGISYSRIDKVENELDYEFCSLDLKYLHHNDPIEAGLDTGLMCSLTLGQFYDEETYRILKFMYTLSPEFLPDLGKKFRHFFKYHGEKHLILYHDRAANAYESVGEDHASKFKKSIEFDENGVKTDWTVTLMSRGQSTILQQTEFELMLQFFKGNNNKLPTLLIDAENCKELKSSCEQAERIQKINKKGEKQTYKNKSSESLDLELLPMHSTNPSDSFKYLMCRKQFLEAINGFEDYNSSDPTVF